MPLTLVHPLAVWPARRARLFSALVIGSMAPDFRRLTIPLGDVPEHTWSAAVLYYLPSALIALFVFHRLVKLPMISLAPRRYQRWLLQCSPSFPFAPLSRFLGIVVVTFVGIATHLIWDSFTHANGAGLRMLGIENKYVQFSAHYRLTMAPFLWDISTIVGLFVLAALLLRAFSRHSETGEREPQVSPMQVLYLGKLPLILIGLALAALPGILMLARDPQYWLHNERRQLVAFCAVSGLDVVLLEVVVFSALWQARNGSSFKRQQRPASH
jgi:hypothetical protein